jgi:hypothetical protein
MKSELPKHHPTGQETRIKDVKPGTRVIVFLAKRGYPAFSYATIGKIIETPQSNNPVVETTSGEKMGGGTSVIIIP